MKPENREYKGFMMENIMNPSHHVIDRLVDKQTQHTIGEGTWTNIHLHIWTGCGYKIRYRIEGWI